MNSLEELKAAVVYLSARLAQVEEENQVNKASASYWLSEYSRVKEELDKCKEG